MSAGTWLFIGGPANGELREIEDPYYFKVLQPPEHLVTRMVHELRPNEVIEPRVTVYNPLKLGFKGERPGDNAMLKIMVPEGQPPTMYEVLSVILSDKAKAVVTR